MLNVKVLTGADVEAYHAEAVVSGVEDYYLGTDAPAGVWCASASLLGLSGDVVEDPICGARLLDPFLRSPGQKRRC